jgi:hypothetical protein
MARPSKLTDAQWEAIGKKLLNNETSAAELAREYGVSKGIISQRFSKRIETVKTAAGLIVQANQTLELLNVSERVEAFNLAESLKAISGYGASAARNGMMTADILSSVALKQARSVGADLPLEENAETIKSVIAISRGANEAASIGLNLLAANKDAMREASNVNQSPENLLREISQLLPN